ncbi:MAG TPA: SHOCT domain-containing protein [Ktedonobacterales bacterium]|nr:SHOCT domain-containing protein [Ktedonobacterales bacterium]
MVVWGYHYGYGAWAMLGGAVMVVGGLALFALLIWGVATLFERGAHPSPPEAPHDSALETLRQRYARGEIDEQTYQRMCQQLLMTSVVPADPWRPTPTPV